jgi:predicted cation transporter
LKLNQKYFYPFLAAAAIMFAIWAVYASFDFKQQTRLDFDKDVAQRDSLLSYSYLKIQDSISIQPLELIRNQHKPLVIVFCASWSENAYRMLDYLSSQYSNDILIIAAYVKDTRTDAMNMSNQLSAEIISIDAMDLYNQLRAPGIPTAIFYDKNGVFIGSVVGFREEEAVRDFIKSHFSNE